MEKIVKCRFCNCKMKAVTHRIGGGTKNNGSVSLTINEEGIFINHSWLCNSCYKEIMSIPTERESEWIQI